MHPRHTAAYADIARIALGIFLTPLDEVQRHDLDDDELDEDSPHVKYALLQGKKRPLSSFQLNSPTLLRLIIASRKSTNNTLE